MLTMSHVPSVQLTDCLSASTAEYWDFSSHRLHSVFFFYGTSGFQIFSLFWNPRESLSRAVQPIIADKMNSTHIPCTGLADLHLSPSPTCSCLLVRSSTLSTITGGTLHNCRALCVSSVSFLARLRDSSQLSCLSCPQDVLSQTNMACW